MTTVRYFAAAADAAGVATEQLATGSLAELRGQLASRHGDAFAAVLAQCSVLADGVRLTDDSARLGPNAVVDVLPPFAGG